MGDLRSEGLPCPVTNQVGESRFSVLEDVLKEKLCYFGHTEAKRRLFSAFVLIFE